MTTKTTLTKRITAMLLAITILLVAIPVIMFPASAAGIVMGEKTSDPSTLDSWKDLFPADSTEQAGRIWTDKTVLSDPTDIAAAFGTLKDVNGNRTSITLNDENNHFLVTLSALASNKSIVGYSYTPTDTMLVLDASGSMATSGYDDDLVTAANSAIQKLLELNKHNRIGVVLYSGHPYQNNASTGNTATVLLPLDRYTHANNRFLVNNNNTISINSNVQNGKGDTMRRTSKDVSGATYVQNGVYMALEELLDSDTVIPDGEVQAGTVRTPIMVLMSDGLPTAATTNFAGQSNTASTVGLGSSNLGFGGTITDPVLESAVDFVNQLTLAFSKAKISDHYNGKKPLFYTLGLGRNNQALNGAVLNPDAFTSTDAHWNAYVKTTNHSSLVIDIEDGNRPDQASILKITEIASVDQKNYVDQYFPASNATGLISAFESIVNQIIIQSLYYPTHVENGNHDNDGYVEFIDDIGHYMDVKEIKGILLGDTLFTGERLAKNFTPSGGDLIDANGSYTEMGNNMIWSVQQRLGIENVQDARDLVNTAYNHKQLHFDENTGAWSNFIGWYADDSGRYLGPWYEGIADEDVPAGATYINRSYGMLGEVTDEHTATDMMYISTQIHTRIADGNVSFIWRIPASLIPVVTYDVTLNGANIAEATSATIDYQAAEPIRIVFEVGLTEDINKVNITDMITDPAEHIIDVNNDGISDDGRYYFYTNWWNDDRLSHTNPSHVEDTLVFFPPSLQNERYYYIEETAVYVHNGTNHVKYTGDALPSATTGIEFCREYIVFEGTGNNVQLVAHYEPMSDATIQAIKAENRNADGSWDVPAGTIHRVLEPYNLTKSSNPTGSLAYVRYPVIERIPETDRFHVGELLGNNGRIAVEIPQGITVSKVIDDTLAGINHTYSFDVTGAADGDYEAYLENADGALTAITVTFNGGKATIQMKADESIHILGVDPGMLTVSENILDMYRVSKITVNGAVQSGTASAAVPVEQHKLSTVVFENTLVVNTGTIVISKEVVIEDANLTANDNQRFTFEVYNKATPNDKDTYTITAGQSVVIPNLTPGDTYVVTEVNVPDGYTPREATIEVTLPAGTNSVMPAHFINDYQPDPVQPNFHVSGTKNLTGRDWKAGDAFTFQMQALHGATWVNVGNLRTVKYGDADYNYSFDFATDADLQTPIEIAGTHYFRVCEVVPTNKLGGVTYDEAYRYFTVVVTDDDMDGQLEIQNVTATAPATVTGTVVSGEKNWAVDIDFTNTYAATGTDELIITIDKTVTDKVGTNHGKDGFVFGLYTVGGTNPILVSNPTDANGKTSFDLTFSAALVGRTYSFEIREIVPDNKVNGMTYVTDPTPVTIQIVDNLDGTATAVVVVGNANHESVTVDFENVYDPADAEVTLSGTKVMDNYDFDANDFTFELVPENASTKYAYNESKANGGKFTFDTLKFDTVGTYRYTLKEKEGNLPGVSYSGKTYAIDIVVSDDADNDGTLDAVIKVDGNEVAENALASTLQFTNTYAAKSVDVVLKATKTLTGRDIRDGEFKFDLYESNAAFTARAPGQNDVALVKQNANTGLVTFSKLTFNTVDTYYYVIVEDEVNGNGVVVDTTVHKITITVTDDQSGQLKAEIKVNGNVVDAANVASAITFTNSYKAAAAKVGLTGTKTIDGRELQDGEFKFDLYNADASFTKGTIAEDDVKLVLQPDGTGKITFADLTFDTADTYYYVIVEDEVDENGVTMDKTEYQVTITVADIAGMGQLAAAVKVNGTDINASSDEVVKFVNQYKAAPAKVSFTATKTIQGRKLKDGEFKFDLYNADASFVKTTIAEDDVKLALQANGTGKITFSQLTFDKVGKHYYVIVEDEVNGKGVTVDTTEHRIVVDVTDNKLGQLVAKVSVNGTEITGSTENAIVFNNLYEIAPTVISISGTKTLTGRDLAKEEFSFELYDANGKLIETVKNAADGKIVFTNIDVTTAGTYEFTVKEVDDDVRGVTYDDTVYTVTVTVTDNGDGTFAVAYAYETAAGTVEGISFKNTYTAPPKNPQTGNASNLWLWLAVMFVSGGCLFGTVVLGKKKNAKQNG